jgi:acyl-CoA reductase-like NAD-dependent aldehyde dehydrogenase
MLGIEAGSVGRASVATGLDFVTYRNCINGVLVDTSEHRHGINPANLEALPNVPVATKEDLDDAISAAQAAFKKWSKAPYGERRGAVIAFADAIEEFREEFIRILTIEQGKPVCLPFMI